MGLSETWLNEKLPNEIYNLSNDFTLVRNDRNWADEGKAYTKKGGGVALFIRNTLNFSDVEFKHLNNSNKDMESQWVSVKQPNSRTILIGNIYRPPQGNIETFTQVLEDILAGMDLSKIEIFIMGDFNIDILDKKNPSTKKLLELIKTFGLRQLIKKPTRYSKEKDSLIDMIITNSDFISNSGVCDVNLSDHQMVIVTRKKARVKKLKCNFIGRSYRNYNKQVFQDLIRDADWNSFTLQQTVSGKWIEMLKIIQVAIDSLCPTKKFKIKQVKEEWITPQLLELIKDKDHAIRKAKKKKDPE